MRVVSGPSYFVHFLGLNVTRPPFDDVRVRQALSYAIDKQGVLDATWGGAGSLCKSPATPSMWSFETDQFKKAYDALPDFAVNVEKAKSLIKAAGAEGKSATLLVGTPHENDEGVIIQAAAKAIGLNITLQNIPYDQLLGKIADKAHDYDGIVLEWSSDYPDPGGTLFQCFVNGRTTDYTAYNVPSVNSALQASPPRPIPPSARRSSSPHRRRSSTTRPGSSCSRRPRTCRCRRSSAVTTSARSGTGTAAGPLTSAAPDRWPARSPRRGVPGR